MHTLAGFLVHHKSLHERERKEIDKIMMYMTTKNNRHLGLQSDYPLE